MTHITDTQQALFAHEVEKDASNQTELENHPTQERQIVSPQELKVIEISFYDHEIYAGKKLIACITYHCDDCITQPWLVMVNGVEIHRANTWNKCHSYIQLHYKQGTLPTQKQDFDSSVNDDNEVMSRIATECEKYQFDLYDDGIYYNDIKLGEVGCTNGKWWVLRVSSQHQEKIICNCALDAVWSLWMVEVHQEEATLSLSTSTPSQDEDLLDRPFDELNNTEWTQLKKYKFSSTNTLLIAA